MSQTGQEQKDFAGELITTDTTNSRGLTIYDKFKDVEKGVQFLANVIRTSQMLGGLTQPQATLLAFACFCEKSHPFAIIRKYRIINGNLAMRADAMQAGFMNAGGKLKVYEHTPEVVDIEGEYNGTKLRVRLTHDDMKKESFYWDKSGKRPKHNWATPYMRMSTLWARAVSTLCRRLTPFVVAGVYTPEEVMDFSDLDDDADATEATPVSVEATVVQEPAKSEDATSREEERSQTQPEAQEVAEETSEEPVKQANNEEFRVTEEQLKKLLDLAKKLGVGAQKMRAGLMKKYGVNRPEDLDVEQADELIASFEDALAKKGAKA